MNMMKRKLSPVYIEYLISQLHTADPSKVKKALQEISKSYREGYFIPPEKIHIIEVFLIGLLNISKDKKIQRWVLNVLARIGTKRQCIEPVAKFLENNPNLDSQIMASGVSALYGMQKNPSDYLKKINISPSLVELSALQYASTNIVNPVHLPILIEKASVDELKLALILAGLGKSCNQVFGNYKDNEVIKILGQHDDPIVSQYTIWAIAENRNFNFSDLGIRYDNIASYPDNVREWFYRLLASRVYAAMAHRDLLEEGTQDDVDSVRAGLARGLKETFFEDLEKITLNWFIREPSLEVRAAIMVHIVGNSSKSEKYYNFLTDFFSEGQNNDLLEVAKASAAGLPIYGHLIRISRHPDLFSGEPKSVYNFNGTVNAPNSAFGNNNTQNNNTTNNEFGVEKAERAKAIIGQVIDVIDEIPEQVKEKNNDLFVEASDRLLVSKSEPSPLSLRNCLDTLADITKIVSSSDVLVSKLNPLISHMEALFH